MPNPSQRAVDKLQTQIPDSDEVTALIEAGIAADAAGNAGAAEALFRRAIALWPRSARAPSLPRPSPPVPHRQVFALAHDGGRRPPLGLCRGRGGGDLGDGAQEHPRARGPGVCLDAGARLGELVFLFRAREFCFGRVSERRQEKKGKKERKKCPTTRNPLDLRRTRTSSPRIHKGFSDRKSPAGGMRRPSQDLQVQNRDRSSLYSGETERERDGRVDRQLPCDD